MGKRFNKVWVAVALTAGLLFGLSACRRGPATPETNGPGSTEQANRAMQIVLSFVPGQSTERDVLAELGEPGGNEEPLIGEWTWLYSLNEDGSSYARVTLDTSSSLRIVKSIEVIQPGLTIAELTDAIGEPDLIFEELTDRHSVLAHPVLDIEAVVAGDPTQPGGAIALLRRGASQSVQSYLDALEGRSDVRIIKRP